MGQDRNMQLSDLRRDFPSSSVVKENSTEVLMKIEHTVSISNTTCYALTLYVSLPSAFPRSAPKAMLPYACQVVPITPPNVSPSELSAYQWDPSGSTLTEAVRNAFQNAAYLWGPVTPPTMESTAQCLYSESDRLLSDLVQNPNCLDAYCYQLPIVKQMRETSNQTITEVERAANENMRLRSEVETLHANVISMQKQLTEQINSLQVASSNKLLQSVCTPNALMQTLERDIKEYSETCQQLGAKALATFSSNKTEFQNLLEKYKNTSKQMHIIDLKRRVYRAQQA